MDGGTGHINVLDWRSHRLQRVCRSSYASETLALEEALDAAQLLRGQVAEMRGEKVDTPRDAEHAIAQVRCVAVVDAKDTHDKVTKDSGGHGAQKSLAYTVGWLRQVVSRPNIRVRWTATENMIVDAMTKDMDRTHLQKTIERGTWSFTYNADFIKTKSKTKAGFAPEPLPETPGVPVRPAEEKELTKLIAHVGWTKGVNGPVLCSKDAKAYRTPEPRFSSKMYPLRTSFGLIPTLDGMEWRKFENCVKYTDLPVLQGTMPVGAFFLISRFEKSDDHK